MSELIPAPEIEPPKLYGRTVAEWHNTLTGENLDVPCSRYGRNAGEVAWYAIASMLIYNEYYPGETDDPEAFADHSMTLVVNDADSIMEFIIEHKHLLPKEVTDELTVEGMPL